MYEGVTEYDCPFPRKTSYIQSRLGYVQNYVIRVGITIFLVSVMLYPKSLTMKDQLQSSLLTKGKEISFSSNFRYLVSITDAV